ncbi:MAG: hypothetical protein MHM6MM_002591 [Cercozoa sp. M6MM]
MDSTPLVKQAETPEQASGENVQQVEHAHRQDTGTEKETGKALLDEEQQGKTEEVVAEVAEEVAEELVADQDQEKVEEVIEEVIEELEVDLDQEKVEAAVEKVVERLEDEEQQSQLQSEEGQSEEGIHGRDEADPVFEGIESGHLSKEDEKVMEQVDQEQTEDSEIQ